MVISSLGQFNKFVPWLIVRDVVLKWKLSHEATGHTSWNARKSFVHGCTGYQSFTLRQKTMSMSRTVYEVLHDTYIPGQAVTNKHWSHWILEDRSLYLGPDLKQENVPKPTHANLDFSNRRNLICRRLKHSCTWSKQTWGWLDQMIRSKMWSKNNQHQQQKLELILRTLRY